MLKQTVTIKGLIGLARLTTEQLERYLDHPNYNLRGLKINILKNNLNCPEYLLSHTILKGMDVQDKDILISIHGKEEEKFDLGKDFILIIYNKDGEPKYAVFNNE